MGLRKLLALAVIAVLGTGPLAYADMATAPNGYKVKVTVLKMTINNTDGRSPKFDIRNVCESTDVILFQDARSSARNNGTPKAIPNNCQVTYLGQVFPVRIFMGGGAYFLDKADRTSSRFSLQGYVAIGTAQASGWISTKTALGEAVEMTIDTVSSSADTTPKISESFRVTYSFYK